MCIKRILISFLLVLIASHAFAQKAFVINRKSGGQIYISFATNPHITFEGANLVLTTTEETLTIPFSDLGSCSFDDSETAIHEIKMSDYPQIKLDSEEAVITGLSDGETINVYNVSGTLQTTSKVENGETRISLAQLHSGTYVIKSNSFNCKIIKK